eukprot:Em0015g793a
MLTDDHVTQSSLSKSEGEADIKQRKMSEKTDAETHDQTDGTTNKGDRTKKTLVRQAYTNIYGLGASIFFLSCGFGGLRNIQSSINSNAGLGVVTLSILYALFMVSSLYTPGLINAFGTKYVYLAGVSGYFLYTAANYYSTWYTLIPACVIAGLASGPVWAASRVHIIQVAIEMAPFLKESRDTVISQFVGIVYLAFQLSSVPGNLASSLILYLTDKDAYGNSTLNTTNASLCTAGTRKIEQKYIYMLISVYMAFMTASLVIAALTVDNTRRAQKQSWKAKIKTVFDVEVFKMLFTWKMALIFPMGMYAGMELSYFTGTFAKDYISNCLGVSQVGFVLIVFGAASAIMSGFIGRLIKYVPHFVFIIVAGLVSAGLLVFLLLWNPVPSYAMVYSFALIWGLTDSVWDTLSSGFIALLFPGKPHYACSCSRVAVAFGNAVGFLIAKVAEPPYVRVVIMLIWLVVTIGSYFVLVARTRTLEQIFLYQVYCPTKAVAKERARQPSLISPNVPVGAMPPLDASHRPDLMVHHLVTQVNPVSRTRCKTSFHRQCHMLFSHHFIVGHPFYPHAHGTTPHDPDFVWRVPVNRSMSYVEAVDAEHVETDV